MMLRIGGFLVSAFGALEYELIDYLTAQLCLLDVEYYLEDVKVLNVRDDGGMFLMLLHGCSGGICVIFNGGMNGFSW